MAFDALCKNNQEDGKAIFIHSIPRIKIHSIRIIDSRANAGGFTGDDALKLSRKNPVVNVQGINNHQMTPFSKLLLTGSRL